MSELESEYDIIASMSGSVVESASFKVTGKKTILITKKVLQIYS